MRFVIQVSQRDVETEKRLKKDLKRTKVLLADAQIMLDHLKSNAPSKREIAQLKNQVCHSIEHFTASQQMTVIYLLIQQTHFFNFALIPLHIQDIRILDLGLLMFVPHLLPGTFFLPPVSHSWRSQSSLALQQ